MIALITCVVLIGLMLLGVPVCAAMGGTAAAMFASLGYGNILAVMAQRIYNGTTSVTMLAIPFFILAPLLFLMKSIQSAVSRLRRQRPVQGSQPFPA